tara:strand:- start:9 stop:227 length:219 start_codon:yes stop_codon:yes gene_type:complete
MNDIINQDIIWEWPEDDWVNLGEHCDMNMWTDDIDGKMWLSIYAVRNGQTDTCKELCTYRMEVIDDGRINDQ